MGFRRGRCGGSDERRGWTRDLVAGAVTRRPSTAIWMLWIRPCSSLAGYMLWRYTLPGPWRNVSNSEYRRSAATAWGTGEGRLVARDGSVDRGQGQGQGGWG